MLALPVPLTCAPALVRSPRPLAPSVRLRVGLCSFSGGEVFLELVSTNWGRTCRSFCPRNLLDTTRQHPECCSRVLTVPCTFLITAGLLLLSMYRSVPWWRLYMRRGSVADLRFIKLVVSRSPRLSLVCCTVVVLFVFPFPVGFRFCLGAPFVLLHVPPFGVSACLPALFPAGVLPRFSWWAASHHCRAMFRRALLLNLKTGIFCCVLDSPPLYA